MASVVMKNVSGQTLDALGEAIVAGIYPPGSIIPPEPSLCESLRVSRTVIREAVKSLVAKGMLVTGPKVGTRVMPPDRWNLFDPQVVQWHGRAGLTREFLRDLHELRRVVEPAAVGLAAERATPDDLAELEAAYAGMKKAVEEGGDYVTFDLRFHQGLLRAAHNRMVEQMGQALAALLRTSFEISTSRQDGPRNSLPRHRAVLDAVISGSPEAARAAALTLIDEAGDDIDHVMGHRKRMPAMSAVPPDIAKPLKA